MPYFTNVGPNKQNPSRYGSRDTIYIDLAIELYANTDKLKQ